MAEEMMASLPSRLRSATLKGPRLVHSPSAPSGTEEGEPSRPVAFHANPTVRRGGQAWVYRAALPKTRRGRVQLPRVSMVALRLQRSDQSTAAHRRLALQVAHLGSTDPVLAAGVVRLREMFLCESVPNRLVLDEDDPVRVRNPDGPCVLWAEVMDWHEQSLHDVLQRSRPGPPWPLAEAVAKVLPLLRALGVAHDDHHVVHRDIDAHNVMYDESTDTLRLTDWGAAVAAQDPGHTITATTRGKVGIQPPELRGRRSGPAQWYNDAWNVGYLLCQLFLGLDKHPLVVNDDDTRVPDLAGLPGDVRAVVTGLLRDRPQDRMRLSTAASRLDAWHERATADLEAQAVRREARLSARDLRARRRRSLTAAVDTRARQARALVARTLRARVTRWGAVAAAAALAVAYVVTHVDLATPPRGSASGSEPTQLDSGQEWHTSPSLEMDHYSEFAALAERARGLRDTGFAHNTSAAEATIESVRPTSDGRADVRMALRFGSVPRWLAGPGRRPLAPPACPARDDATAPAGIYLAIATTSGAQTGLNIDGFDLVPATCHPQQVFVDPESASASAAAAAAATVEGWTDWQDHIDYFSSSGGYTNAANDQTLTATFDVPVASDSGPDALPYVAGVLVATGTTANPSPSDTASVWATTYHQYFGSDLDEPTPAEVRSVSGAFPIEPGSSGGSPMGFVAEANGGQLAKERSSARLLAVREEDDHLVATVRLTSLRVDADWPDGEFELTHFTHTMAREGQTGDLPYDNFYTGVSLLAYVTTADGRSEWVGIPAEDPVTFAQPSDSLGSWEPPSTAQDVDWSDDGPVVRFVLPDSATAIEAGVWHGELWGLVLSTTVEDEDGVSSSVSAVARLAADG